MKTITGEWLERAKDDLRAAEILLQQPELTNMVAFHAQQVVEKSLKAILEEANISPIRTHSLTRLYGLAKTHLSFSVDGDMLDRLEAVYIEARYPAEIGLLPDGKPSQVEANRLYDFAKQFYENTRTVCGTSE